MSLELRERRPDREVERQSSVYIIKFGGSSVGNAQAIEETVGFINHNQKDGRQTVVVVSAMDGVTDQIVSICNLLEKRRSEVELLGVVYNIRARHMEVVSKLNLPDETRFCLERQLDSLFFCMQEDVTYCGELTSERKEKISDYGGRFAARIVATKTEQLKGVKVVDEATYKIKNAPFIKMIDAVE